MTRLVLSIGSALVGAATRAAEPTAVQTGTPRRVIAADDSKRTLAAIGTDGRVEWRLPCGSIHDLHLLPGNGHSVIEVTPAKKVVWTFKDFTTFGHSLPVAVVLDP